jgi:hypothetical protein
LVLPQVILIYQTGRFLATSVDTIFVGLAYQGKDIVFRFIIEYNTIFVGLAYRGKDIVFRFIIEYSSLMDFGP